MLANYIISVLAGYSLALLTWLAARLDRARRQKVRRRKTGEFFGVTQHAPLLIVHAATYDSTRKDWDWPLLDSHAVTLITGILIEMGMNLGSDFKIIPHPDAMLADGVLQPHVRRSNLILVGGPKRNALTRAVFSSSGLRYSLNEQVGDRGIYCFHDSVGEADYAASEDKAVLEGIPPPTEGDDWGIIISTESPFDRERTAVVLAGLHGLGTLGAAQVVRDESRLAQLWGSRGPEGTLERLVKVRYVDVGKQREIVDSTVL